MPVHTHQGFPVVTSREGQQAHDDLLDSSDSPYGQHPQSIAEKQRDP